MMMFLLPMTLLALGARAASDASSTPSAGGVRFRLKKAEGVMAAGKHPVTTAYEEWQRDCAEFSAKNPCPFPQLVQKKFPCPNAGYCSNDKCVAKDGPQAGCCIEPVPSEGCLCKTNSEHDYKPIAKWRKGKCTLCESAWVGRVNCPYDSNWEEECGLCGADENQEITKYAEITYQGHTLKIGEKLSSNHPV